MSDNKFQVVFVLGGPGVGKGTQCALVIEKMQGWDTLSAGDLLRAERNADPPTETGKTINERISQGLLVPSEITVGLLKAAMEKTAAAGDGKTKKFLVDGFPRSQENVDAWLKVCPAEFATVQGVMYFSLQEEEMLKRCFARAEADKAAGKAGRGDDSAEVMKKRFETNRKECEPIVELFRSGKGGFGPASASAPSASPACQAGNGGEGEGKSAPFVVDVDGGAGSPDEIFEKAVSVAVRGFESKMPAALQSA